MHSNPQKIILITVSSIALIMAVLCTSLFLLQKKGAAQVLPISYVKEEYIRCISLDAENDVIGECLKTLSIYAYDSYEINDIIAELSTLTNEHKNNWCHDAMHAFGWRAFQREGTVEKAFLKASSFCDNAMYHGIVEEYLREHGMEGNISQLIKNICTESQADNSRYSAGTKALCYHGIGHGLMYITNANLEKSLDYCDELGSHAAECYSGSIMEYKISWKAGIQYVGELDDFKYCTEMEDETRRTACYFTQGIDYSALVHGDVRQAMLLCANIPEKYHQECYKGVGSNTPHPGRSHADSGIACKEALEVSEAAYKGCIEGGVSFVAQLGQGNPKDVFDFCDVSSDSEKNYCFYVMGSNLRSWLKGSETIADTKCDIIPYPEGRAECIRGGQW